jgi:S-(hydroxymethyl)mycothiol dehydrogenase
VVDRGLVLSAPGVVALEEIELDEPGSGEVRVRMTATGVCHSDLHIIENDGWGHPLPVLLGHEGTGIVEEVGEGAEHLRPGDVVVLAWRSPCGKCAPCLRGEPRRCATPLRARRRLHRANGDALTQALLCGTFATRTNVHAGAAIKVPSELPPEQACLLGCAVATGVGSVLHTARVWPGARVAVIGCGAVGLSVIQGARIAGASEIHALDLDERKLEQARSFGATHTGAPEEVDFVFDVVGGSQTFEQALAMLALNGTLTLIGLSSPEAKATVELAPFFDRRSTVRVSHGGDHLPAEDFPRLARLALDGELDLAGMVTRVIALEDVVAAFEDMKRGDVIRSVVRL